MAVSIYVIRGNRYAYNRFRKEGKLESKYLGPVDKNNKIRKVKYGGDGVKRAPIGTTIDSLKEIYNKSVRRQAREDAERVEHNRGK